jgi:pantoate--beta-alanine ligase
MKYPSNEGRRTMKIIGSIKAMSGFSGKARARGKKIGFVPTMGALHAGHLSLIRRARRDNDLVVVSIFVNPLQFGPCEDFREYPRNSAVDSWLCRREGVDAVFSPGAKEMYGREHRTFVEVAGLSDRLCGRSRPGHFKGVATVVLKLFNIVSPHNAYFGAKDAQQSAIIKKMTEDLNLPVRIVVLPIVRDADGLALSSRNKYLDRPQREQALCLSRCLRETARLIKAGERDPVRIKEFARRLINACPQAKIDYVEIADPLTMEPLKSVKKGKCLAALAVRIGKTRLIDNATLEVK